MEKKYGDYMDEITANELYEGLLGYGMFANKLPLSSWFSPNGERYAKEHIPDIWLPEWEIFALDSTTISCSIKLMSWAFGKYERGAV